MKVTAIDGNDIAQSGHWPMNERPKTIISVGVSQLGKEVDTRCPHGSIASKNRTEEGAGGNGRGIVDSKMHRGKLKGPVSYAKVARVVISPGPDRLIALQGERHRPIRRNGRNVAQARHLYWIPGQALDHSHPDLAELIVSPGPNRAVCFRGQKVTAMVRKKDRPGGQVLHI